MKFLDWMFRLSRYWKKEGISLPPLEYSEAYAEMQRFLEEECLQEARVVLKKWQYVQDQKTQLEQKDSQLRDHLLKLKNEYRSEIILESDERLEFDFRSGARWNHFWEDGDALLEQKELPSVQVPQKQLFLKALTPHLDRDPPQQYYDAQYLDQESDELLRFLSV